MAYDAFLKIEGVKGESTAKGMADYMEIFSYSFGASNPSTIGSGSTGFTGGRASLSSFNVMKRSEKASALLFQRCCQGQHFPKAEVVLRKATGDSGGQQVFLRYKFEKVLVDSIQWSGSSNGDNEPVESLSFSFGKVEIEYLQQDDKGAPKTAAQAAWDVTTVSS